MHVWLALIFAVLSMLTFCWARFLEVLSPQYRASHSSSGIPTTPNAMRTRLRGGEGKRVAMRGATT
jgi:hypothetical protein